MEEEVRNELEQYIDKHGATLAFMAKEIGIHRETLSRFKHNKRKLSEKLLFKIREYVKAKY